MRLGPLLALIAGAGYPAVAAEFLGSHVWMPEFDGAGGYSALWLDPEGSGAIMLSDKGHWLRADLERNARGAVDRVAVAAHGPLMRSTGGQLRSRETDAEAIARVDGVFYVSYEQAHRVMRHADIAGPPERFAQDGAFSDLEDNSGLEALAADADGNLYAIPERSGGRGRPFPVYRYDGESWSQPFGLRRDGRFLVAGADVGPDGRLYVLERDFAVLGFRSRVRSFDLTGGDERVVLETGMGVHDNLESIEVWRDTAGRLRLTMLSDNNMLPVLQRTEFVDYALD